MLGLAWVERVLALGAVGTLLATSGCGAFFVCEGKTSCGGTSTTNTGDVVFATNEGSTNLYAYSIGTDGSLTTVSGSPTTLTYQPTAMVLTPDNSVMYVSSAAGITSYVVSSTGVLSANTAAISTNQAASASMAISPNGKWLITLDAINGSVAPYLREYAIGTGGSLSTSTTNGATGFALGSVQYPNQTLTPTQVTISADGAYIALALGNAGYQIYAFNQATGVITSTSLVGSGGANSNTVADASVAFDGNDNLYVARTTGIVVYSTSSLKDITPSSGPYTTGGGPRALTFGSNYSFLYAANRSDSTISSYSVSSSGTLTPVSTDTGPAAVQALARDKTGKFLLSGGTNVTSGLQVSSIGTSGSLTAGKTAVNGSVSNYVPLLVAMQ